MVQLSKLRKDANRIRMRVLPRNPEVKAFHSEGKAKLSWNTAALEFAEALVFQNRRS